MTTVPIIVLWYSLTLIVVSAIAVMTEANENLNTESAFIVIKVMGNFL